MSNFVLTFVLPAVVALCTIALIALREGRLAGERHKRSLTTPTRRALFKLKLAYLALCFMAMLVGIAIENLIVLGDGFLALTAFAVYAEAHERGFRRGATRLTRSAT